MHSVLHCTTGKAAPSVGCRIKRTNEFLLARVVFPLRSLWAQQQCRVRCVFPISVSIPCVQCSLSQHTSHHSPAANIFFCNSLIVLFTISSTSYSTRPLWCLSGWFHDAISRFAVSSCVCRVVVWWGHCPLRRCKSIATTARHHTNGAAKRVSTRTQTH